MTRRALAVSLILGLCLLSFPAFAAGAIRRFALVTAANDGGPDRPPLQYALSDAECGEVTERLSGIHERQLDEAGKDRDRLQPIPGPAR